MRRAAVAGVSSVLVALALGLAVAGATPQGPATLTGPQLTPNTRTVEPGQRIDVIFTGWTAGYATLAVCGNQAVQGSADCNMIESTGVRLTRSDGGPSTVHDMVVPVPPSDCPCVIRAVAGDTAEVAVAPIEVVGHPTSPVIAPDPDQALIDVGLTTAVAPAGVLEALRTSLGGPSPQLATVTVHNLTTEPIDGVAVHGRALRDGDTAAEFDLEPGQIGPGQTWTGTAEVTLPAPAVGTYVWRVTATGAGPAATAEVSVRSVPWLLVVLVLALVGVVVATVVRAVDRRRQDRPRALDPGRTTPVRSGRQVAV